MKPGEVRTQMDQPGRHGGEQSIAMTGAAGPSRSGRALMRRLALAALLALVALPAAAQIREPPALRKAHLDLQQCLGRAAGHASGQAEATPDTVADYAARQCEDKPTPRW